MMMKIMRIGAQMENKSKEMLKIIKIMMKIMMGKILLMKLLLLLLTQRFSIMLSEIPERI